MATQSQLPQQAAANIGSVREAAAESALVQTSPVFDGSGGLSKNQLFGRLPVEMDVAVPVRQFRVRNLLALAAGQVIESQWVQGEDMPLAARGAQLAWTEFEVIETKLAVRITRLV
jgi:flagellar motor switch protein FliN/FliY